MKVARFLLLLWCWGIITVVLGRSIADAATWAMQSHSIALRDIGDVSTYLLLWLVALDWLWRAVKGVRE